VQAVRVEATSKEQPFDPADHFVKFMQWFGIRPKIARSQRFAFSGSLQGRPQQDQRRIAHRRPMRMF
jgi:hypothetical protein